MKKAILPVFLFLFSVIIPGTAITGCKNEARKKKEFTILTYNVRNCRGLDNVTDYQRVADIINRIDPHIVALQEIDSATQRSNGVVVLNEIAHLTGMHPTYGASISYQGGKYGVGILTKDKPLSWTSVPLPGREERRSLLIVELKDAIICCTHFSLTEEDRMESAIIINDLFNESVRPVFLAGDLNATPESAVIKKIEEKWIMLNDPHIPTFPADNPDRCIDYIFILKGTDAGIIPVKSHMEHEPLASDHLPVWVK
ncbi:MAG: endonuclease/exonuclease/phosphatase family protein [Bacteroidales bacterium]